MSEPKYATARTPGLVSYGECVSLAAAYLGTPLMPWQRQVADVITELDPSDPRRWRYRTAMITVPRQSGKTALLRALAVDRIMRYKNHAFMMTAQTGKDARKRWMQIVEAVGAKKKPNHFAVRQSQGSERMEYLKRNSYIAPFAPTPKSLHGDTIETVSVDEAWAFDEISGGELMAAIKPTQLTVPNAQLLIVSTRGTANSLFLNTLIDQGRQAVSNPNSRMAYFEWSADEDAADRDPFSVETLSFHPALGYTQTIDDIRGLYDGNIANYRRGVLNLDTPSDVTAIDLAIWAGLASEDLRPGEMPYAVGYSVARDGSGATICAGWLTPDGDVALSIIAQAPGRTWLREALAALRAAGVSVIVGDNEGVNRTVYDELKEALPGLTCLNAGQYGTACQTLLDRVAAGELVHSGALAWAEAIRVVATRPYGGVTGFDEAKSPAPIDALKAAALATYAATRLLPMQSLQLY